MVAMDRAHNNDDASAPGIDIVPNLVAGVGSFSPCRAIRFTTTGTFIGVTLANNTRTVTGYFQGEQINVSFKSRTGGTADVELIY